jgi:two-component system nitrate/nitrite response regulator NarL
VTVDYKKVNDAVEARRRARPDSTVDTSVAKGISQSEKRVLVLDSQPVWLRAIESILAEAGFETISTGSSEEALTTLRRQKVAVLLLGIDGLEDWERVLEAARRKRPRAPKLVVMAAHEDPRTVERALELGADAYVAKRAQPEDVPFVVRQVLSPEVYEVRPAFRSTSKSRDPNGPPPGSGLTPREHEILGLVAQGRSNAEIAKELGISEPTVKGHLWRLYRKIGVPNRTAAARWVTRSQLLDRG